MPVALAGSVLIGLTLPGLLPDGTLWAARGLPAVVVLRGMFAASFFGAETFVPLMLVRERGLSPALAGLTLTGGAVGWAAGSWLQARPALRVPRHVLLGTGGLIVAACVWTMTVITRPWAPVWAALPIWATAGLGMGVSMASISVLLLRFSETGEEGRNSAALQISDALGSVIGIGGAAAVFAALHHPAGSDAAVFRLIWIPLGVIAALTFPVALRARS